MSRPKMQGAAATPAATPATPAATLAAAVLSPVKAVLALVRYNADRITRAAVAYITKPESLAEVTPRQWVALHNLAVSLVGVGSVVDLGSKRKGNKREVTEDDLKVMEGCQPAMLAAYNALTAAGKTPRLVYVHQAYTPVVFPGDVDETLPPLYAQYAAMLERGEIAPQGVTFVAAVQEAKGQGLLAERGAPGGYVLADAKDAEANKPLRAEINKARKGTKRTAAKVDLAARFARVSSFTR